MSVMAGADFSRWKYSPGGLILFGERPLSRTLAEFSAHYHGERNPQGKGNKLLFPQPGDEAESRGHTVACRQRLGDC